MIKARHLFWTCFHGVALAAPLVALAPASASAADQWRIEWAEHIAATVVGELNAACPPSGPGDQAAFEKCRDVVFRDAVLADNMRDFILWGGRKDDSVRLEDAKLTQFNSDIFRGMYLPLFMFTGQWTGRVDGADNRYVFRAEARFRNALEAGQYPYPFWHTADKWDHYLKANEVVFTVDLQTDKIIALQRSMLGQANPALDARIQYAITPPPQPFTKDEWMWRDEAGQTQPSVALFRGMYSDGNPYLAALDRAYVDFALEMRNNTCFVCHVPNNPEKMRQLVLLQTPAHAAGEIDRIIRGVEAGAMPAESWAGPKGIRNPEMKAKFLATARAFKAEVDAARQWEEDQRVSTQAVASIDSMAQAVAAIEPAAAKPGPASVSPVDLVTQRRASMKELGEHMRALAAYIEGVSSDAASLLPHVERIKVMAVEIPTWFPAGTSLQDGVAAKTGAKAEIWSDWGTFEGKAHDLSTEVAKLVGVVAAGDKTAIEAQFQLVGRNGCGSCHESFREKINE
jgi:cytochrome c556